MFRGFVVEDDEPVRAALIEGLAELGGVTTVGFASDEQTAIAWLSDPANMWDIAIVDLHLGSGGSGFRVLEKLARRQPHQRVVVWTAAADALTRTRCRVLGCDRFFDRAGEFAELMDYCTAESEAQARAASGSDRFPPPPAAAGVTSGALAAAVFSL